MTRSVITDGKRPRNPSKLTQEPVYNLPQEPVVWPLEDPVIVWPFEDPVIDWLLEDSVIDWHLEELDLDWLLAEMIDNDVLQLPQETVAKRCNPKKRR